MTKAYRTAHSPSPWTESAALSSDAYHIRYINDANGDMVAEVRSGFSHCNPDPFGQDVALSNADLIKAAPDLLATAKRAALALDLATSHTVDPDAVLNELLRAIARATEG